MNTEATHESNAAKTTGERLRVAREELGLSQQAVAERLPQWLHLPWTLLVIYYSATRVQVLLFDWLTTRFAVTGVVRQAGGAFTITWSSVPGKVYQVQAALSPAGPYSPSGGVIQATGSSASYTDPQPSGSHGFYRVAVVP